MSNNSKILYLSLNAGGRLFQVVVRAGLTILYLTLGMLWANSADGTLMIFMPPTSKKLGEHIASGLFVRPSVRPFVTLFDA